MDYGHPERADRLAAEYAAGLLRGGARRRFERLLPAHPALAAAAAQWAERLELLGDRIHPVEPPARVWIGIQRKLFGAANDAQATSSSASSTPLSLVRPEHRRQLLAWRVVGSAALAASLALGFLVIRPVEPQAPIVVVLHETPQGLALSKTGFVASVSPDGRALVLKPLGPLKIEASQALELWAVPAEGTPRSLGLLATGDGATTVVRAGLLKGTKAFAVSLEPAGGSPTGQPSGPVVSAGNV